LNQIGRAGSAVSASITPPGGVNLTDGNIEADSGGPREGAQGAEGRERPETISSLPSWTRTALGKLGAAVAARKRTGGSSPKTRTEFARWPGSATSPADPVSGGTSSLVALASARPIDPTNPDAHYRRKELT
jgi:hypothetical protein